MQGEILIRQLNDPVASWSVAGLRYVVEFWTDEMAYPVGQAWVSVCDVINYLDWITVQDDYRRKGVATALLKAVLERWPDACYEGATEAGEAFVEAFDARKVT